MARGPMGPVSGFMQANPPLVEAESYVDPLNRKERMAIIVIAKLPTISPKQVGDLIGAKEDIMSRIVKRLAGLGWVMERKSQKDRRVTQLGVTAKGLEAIYDHLAASKALERGTFEKNLNLRPWEGEEFDPERFRTTFEGLSEMLRGFRENTARGS